MSYNILVIPEDPTLDHYVLKPVITAASRHAGFSRAVVRVMTDPAMQGVSHVLNRETLSLVVGRYPQVDLFLIVVDRDGLPSRDQALGDHVSEAQRHLRGPQRLGGRTAEQELEVWCLAGIPRLPSNWSWKDIRADPSPKEVYFQPEVARLRMASSPGGGREILGRQAAQRYASVRSRCPELQDLEVLIRR